MDRIEGLINRGTIIEVDLNKLSYNVKLIKDMVGREVSVMAVVKADGYGHGAVDISRTIMESGADYLAVATLTEALEIRKVHSDYNILILGYTPDEFLEIVVKNKITQTIFSLHQAHLLNQIAIVQGKRAVVHIKVDTGFHRLGKEPSDDFLNEVLSISKLNNVVVEGIFTHLALVSDAENENQYNKFMDFVEKIESKGLSIKYKHIADSIAAVDYPEYRLNMVRAGALLYGMRGYHKGYLPVEQVVTFKTTVSQLHNIRKGEGVGYNYFWKAERNSTIATMPFGYADGYPRDLRNKGYVIINGQKAPIVGTICMDQCMADVTDIENVSEGSLAVIYGDGKDGSMTIDEVSKLAETNKNDIMSRLALRPTRIYI